MNKVVLLGRIGKDLEVKQFGETNILKFSLAVDDGFGDKKKTNWINCIAFNKTAENINKFFSKGDNILICGKISASSYKDKEGVTKYSTDIIINEFDFVGNKNKQKPSREPIAQWTSEEMPF